MKNVLMNSEDTNSNFFIVLLNFLLISSLSMLYAEVTAGSSNLWFIDLFGVILTFPLYGLHVLFYVNVAVRTKRTSIGHLYLWGMLFALYEAPITQVLWSGYMGSSPMWGTFLGVAVGEFIALVFFWHPIMSFIFPVLIYEMLILGQKGERNINEDLIFPTHTKIIHWLKKRWFLVIFYFILIAGFQLNGSGYNIITAILAITGSALLVLLFYGLEKLVRKKQIKEGRYWTIYSLKLTNGGFIALIVVMIAYIYGFGSFIISKMLPNRWPTNAIAYISILIFALIVILNLAILPNDSKILKANISLQSPSSIQDTPQIHTDYNSNSNKTKERNWYPSLLLIILTWIAWLIGVIILGFIPPIAAVFIPLMYLALYLFALIAFIVFLVWEIKTASNLRRLRKVSS